MDVTIFLLTLVACTREELAARLEAAKEPALRKAEAGSLFIIMDS